MARRKANGGGMTPTPPKTVAVVAISSVAGVKDEEDLVATTFVGLGIGILETPVT